MDFLDSNDLKTKQIKSRRVRSWYLYEQFKSLERNQLDAAQKLKDKSYQDRILRQELSERRARRQLYDKFGLCHSESCLDKSACEGKTSLSASRDDFLESFHELEDGKSTQGTDRDAYTEEAYNEVVSQMGKRYFDDFKSLENIEDDQSIAGSVDSVIQNYISNENCTEDLNDEIKHVKKSIAEEIKLQFETVKENIQSLEKYSKLCSRDMISEDSCQSVREDCLKTISRASRESELNLCTIWSKLVSFAYQVTQLNHGNCYYDYSSQFLTAVLACDVLRKCINRMCHILQPYVSPIKFTTDDVSTTTLKRIRREKLLLSKKSKKSIQNKAPTNKNSNKAETHEIYISDQYRGNLSKHSFGYKNKVKHKSSEAGFITCRSDFSETSSCDVWPSISGTSCLCPYHMEVTNPMLKIGQYIDRILKEIDDCTPV